MSFKSQQEIWLYLAQGGAVQSTQNGSIHKFENGRYNDSFTFVYPDEWQPYVETPKKVKKTFYRRRWRLDGGQLSFSVDFRESKEEFDKINLWRACIWSDEWETIEIELPEEAK